MGLEVESAGFWHESDAGVFGGQELQGGVSVGGLSSKATGRRPKP